VVFENQVGGSLKHPERIVVVFDHQFSPPTEDKAEVLLKTREFCYKHGITLYDCGSGNVHVAAMQNGHIRPGALVVGSDSHSPVHGVMGTFCAALATIPMRRW
jgi:3-isopropylmalate/(R)-2-methylmalate dehydratase large subunit